MTTRSWLAARALVRPRSGRWIAGVAAGLARRFDMPVSHMRLLWVVSVVLPGPQVVLYIGLWILMPAEQSEPT